MQLINIIAILISPVVAVLISIRLQDRKEKRQQKIWLLHTLIAARHTPITDENVRAFNMIDIVFWDKPSIRRLWKEYFEMLNNAGLNNELGWRQRKAKHLELITEMAGLLGYKKAISSLDVDRIYYPEGLGKSLDRNEAIANELLRVLKASTGFSLTSNAAARGGVAEPALTEPSGHGAPATR